jgi:hypothetical protein
MTYTDPQLITRLQELWGILRDSDSTRCACDDHCAWQQRVTLVNQLVLFMIDTLFSHT